MKSSGYVSKKNTAISRRNFLMKSGGLCSSAWLTTAGCSLPAADAADRELFSAQIHGSRASGPIASTNADVGSLFPVIQSQAVQSDFPLSFLNSRFKSVK